MKNIYLLTTLFISLLTWQFSFAQSNHSFPVDVLESIQLGQASVTHSTIDIGTVASMFDGDLNTVARSANINPMEVTLTFDFPVEVSEMNTIQYNSGGWWSIETADNLSDLENNTGTYDPVFIQMPLIDHVLDVQPMNKTAKIFRLTMYRAVGDGFVHLQEWGITAVASVEITDICFVPNEIRMIKDAEYDLDIAGFDVDGNRFSLESNLDWWSSNSGVVSVDNTGFLNSNGLLDEVVITAEWNGISTFTNLKVVDDFERKLAPEQTVKVALVIIDPTIPNGTTTFSEHFWGYVEDPITLTSRVRDSLTALSGGVANYQVVETHYQEDLMTTFGDVELTSDSMFQLFNEPGWTTLHEVAEHQGRSVFHYNELLELYDLCSKSNNHEIDEVWVYAMPFIGMAEAAMTGTNAFRINGPVISGNDCVDHLPIMGFNYERTYDLALHNYVHRTEWTMRVVFGRWDENLPITQKNEWELFTTYDQIDPGNAHIGWGHYPPNGIENYGYYNTEYVSTYEPNWKRYPFLFQETRDLNCEDWNCDHDGFQRWWLRHLPKYSCKDKNGILNNWWHYVIDYNEARAMESQVSDCDCEMFDDPDIDEIDLALTLTVPNNQYEIYEYVTYNLSVSNNSSTTADDVIIDFPKPVGMAYSDQTISQGSYSDWTGKWKVGTLDPNETATLELVLFTLVEDQIITSYAQVETASPNDSDSTPGNGNCCMPVEDDEAVVEVYPLVEGGKADLSLVLNFEGTPCGDLPDCNGVEYRFALFVSNDGPDDVEDVMVEYGDGNSFFVGDIAAGETFSNGLAWTVYVPFVTPGVIPPFPYAPFAQVVSASLPDPDSTPGNNSNFIPNEDDESLAELPMSTQIDLELDLTVANDEYEIYEYVYYTLVVRNNSTVTAEEIIVDFLKPEGTAFSDQTLSQGSYYNWTGKWDVGTLGPNEAATLELVLFTLVEGQTITCYAQIEAAASNDSDSNPGNGICCTPMEDDEAVVEVYPLVEGSQADLSLLLNFEGTPCGDLPDCNGVEYRFSLFVSNDGPDDVEDVIVEYGDGNSFYVGDIAAGETFSNGLAWTVYVPFVTSGVIPPFPYAPFAQVVSASLPDPDSTPGNNSNFIPNEDDESLADLPMSTQIDLELDLTVANNEYEIYEFVYYTLVVRNNSTVTAEEVVVDFLKPEGTAFSDQYLSQGSYYNWTGEWKVGTLGPNGTATLELVLFTLVEDQTITCYAQVEAAASNDSDSNPGNGICCTPMEDDEAVVEIYPAASLHSDGEMDLTINENLAMQVVRVFPNPATEEITVYINSKNELSQDLQIYNNLGQLQRVETVHFQKGFNSIEIDISAWPTGVYYILIPDMHRRKVEKVKFVKLGF